MVRWQSHWHVVRQSWPFFQADFAGRIANKVMQTGPAVRDTLTALITGVWYILVYGTTALILLASADGYTPRANSLLDQAREDLGAIMDIANALADNLPAPKTPVRKSRRRRKKRRSGAVPAPGPAPEDSGWPNCVPCRSRSRRPAAPGRVAPVAPAGPVGPVGPAQGPGPTPASRRTRPPNRRSRRLGRSPSARSPTCDGAPRPRS
jgi:hypothetical protein